MLFHRVRPRLTRHGVPRDRRSPFNTEGSKIIAVDYLKKHSSSKSSGSRERRFTIGGLTSARLLLCLLLGLLLCGLPTQALAQSGQTPAPGAPKAPAAAAAPAAAQQADQQKPGGIRGTVADQSGNLLIGAVAHLTREGQPAAQDIVTGDNGDFSYANLAPGSFQLTVTAPGYGDQAVPIVVHPGEAVVVPQVVMSVAGVVTSVTVTLPPVELAQVQVQEQETQRILRIVPNFYVSYIPNAASLTTKEKLGLAWKSSTDPFTFAGVAAIAGFQQAGDEFHGYGQGLEGYGKRYGAFYGDVVIGTFLGSAIFPSILRQDPRYFYRGTGSKRSRLLYALSNSIICKGDNGNMQPNYSYVLGSFVTGAIASYYYPEMHRSRANLILETGLVRLGENSISSAFQEFFLKKVTSARYKHNN
jgi:Carboxypeptidase regulatory-like domain